MKNPLTPARIEPAIFRFVALHLNHCATAVPSLYKLHVNNVILKNEHVIQRQISVMTFPKLIYLHEG